MDLTQYDIILVNTSAGKDSQVMLDEVYRLAVVQGCQSRVVAVHCDLGRVEWKGTAELAQTQCDHYGVPLHYVKRNAGDLLVHIEARGMFPSNTTRYCTSDHKRAQVCRVLTQLVDSLQLDRRAKVLNCMGLRADESPARAKRIPFIADDPTYSNKTRRQVDTWLPIHAWTVEQVWARIRETGVPHHYAYDLGMPRLSCCFCIFAPRPALLIAGEHNPELLAEYVRVEQRINHTLREKQSLAEIQDALARGERGAVTNMQWMRCA
jgi:3'-phosphoadenosine 5'-phosphosulfate sulfotransferase (PAPS reductase)/FAD synthetase